MDANETMTRDVTVVPAELPLAVAWDVMTEQRIRHLPVVRAGALIGILSDRDVLVRATIDGHGNVHVDAKLLVGEAMSPTPLVTCEESTDVARLARTMIDKKIDALPIVKGLRLVGLVTTTDLLALLVPPHSEPMPFQFRIVEDPRAYA